MSGEADRNTPAGSHAGGGTPQRPGTTPSSADAGSAATGSGGSDAHDRTTASRRTGPANAGTNGPEQGSGTDRRGGRSRFGLRPRPGAPGPGSGSSGPGDRGVPAASGDGEDGEDGTVPGRRLNRMNPFTIGLVGGLGALTAWALATMVVQARAVLMLIIVALYLAMGLNPVVEWLQRRRVPRGLGVLGVFLGLLGVVGLILTSVVPVVTQQVTALIGQVPTWFEQLQRNSTFREFDQKYDLAGRAEEYITQGQLGQQLAGGVIGFGVVVVSTLFAAFTILVLTIYFLGSLPKILNAVYSLVPRSRRARITYLGNQSVAKIGNYVGGQLLVAGLAGVMSFFFLSVVGLREYAVALAAAVALFDLVPLIGGAISAVTVTSIAFFTELRIGIICAIYYVLYQQVENYWIMPRVMAHAVKVPGTVVVVAALLGGSMFGMVGALLAVPTSAAILMLIREVVIPRQQAA